LKNAATPTVPLDLLLVLRHIKRAKAILNQLAEEGTATVNGHPMPTFDGAQFQEAYGMLANAEQSVCGGMLSGLLEEASVFNVEWRETP
jgi:hypothetical protein